MSKMSKRQLFYFNTLREFLKTGIGEGGILVDNNDITNINNITKICNCLVEDCIVIVGYDYNCSKEVYDTVERTQIYALYTKAYNRDCDFKTFADYYNFYYKK